MSERSNWRRLLLVAILGCLVTMTGCYYQGYDCDDDDYGDHHYGGHHHDDY